MYIFKIKKDLYNYISLFMYQYFIARIGFNKFQLIFIANNLFPILIIYATEY